MYKKFVKRIIDIVISGIALIVLSPLLVIVALLVKIKFGSPVIFKQKRPGFKEKIFTMYKFRTMSDKRNEFGELLSDDYRLTSFGIMLRSTSLDELPELWNIFKGDMSIVGPRPLLEEYLPLYTERQRLRHTVRPGLTGLAQVSGRNLVDWTDKFELDCRYVEEVTFCKDVRIFFATFKTVFRKEGIANKNKTTVEKYGGVADE